MNRCLELARNGLGTTYPNPLVGCVIVHEGKIIGEGWHKKSGEPHAEINAIASVKDKSLLKESTLYVNLEPCSHFGKTPPCAHAIIDLEIPEVVIGTKDPNPIVSGTGIALLEKAGCQVTVGILERDCNELNKRFFTFQQKKRPYVILKWAETKNGFIAPETKNSKAPFWISNQYSRQLTHKWRSEEQAILVGSKTVIDDDPALSVRDWSGPNPIRIIIGKSEKLPQDSQIFNDQAETIFLEKPENQSVENVDWIIKKLYDQNIQSVIVEGGASTLRTFIDSGIWDEARVFIGNITFESGVSAPKIHGKISSSENILNDILTLYKNEQH